jgi:hypothetical protein
VPRAAPPERGSAETHVQHDAPQPRVSSAEIRPVQLLCAITRLVPGGGMGNARPDPSQPREVLR